MQLLRFIKKEFNLLPRYTIVGISGTFIDVAALYLLVEFANFPYLLATSISFLLAVFNNYYWNKVWTFKAHSSNSKAQFIKFFLVSIVGFILTDFFMFFFVELFAIWYILAKIITSGIVLNWNFLSNKMWTFRPLLDQRESSRRPLPLLDRRESSRRPLPLPLSSSLQLSIVIPAYNEEKRLPKTLAAIQKFLQKTKLKAEIIVVNDGSTDNTIKIIEQLKTTIPELKLINYSKNQGKGYAVKKGIQASQGQKILFTDADNSTPIEELPKLMAKAEKGYKVVFGSRYLKKNSIKIKQPLYRKWLGRVGNSMIQFLLVEGIKDSQCGFKLFSYEAAQEIFARQKVKRFGFDMEALVIAKNLGYKMAEVPVSWYNDGSSKVRPFKDALITFKDLIRIKLYLLEGLYDDEQQST